MQLSEKRIIIFDFDGTLADSLAAIVATAREVLTARGMTDEELGDMRRLVGPPFPQAYSEVYGLSEQEAIEVTQAYRARYEALGRDAWPLFSGMIELLHDLVAAHKTLAIASSKRQEVLLHALADNGCTELFGAIEGKHHDAGHKKSDSIAAIMRSFQARVDECVMVGDRRYDIEAAQVHGMESIGVLYGKTCEREELEDADATAIADSVGELRQLLLGV